MDKHTPGPWFTGPLGASEIEIYAPDGDDIDSSWFIGHVYDNGGPYLDSGEANARLMASAPAMLSLLRRWSALDAGSWNIDRHARDTAELLAETQAAIRQATGSQP